MINPARLGLYKSRAPRRMITQSAWIRRPVARRQAAAHAADLRARMAVPHEIGQEALLAHAAADHLFYGMSEDFATWVVLSGLRAVTRPEFA
jgi:hypothetical protein